jgi:hypothetical protein
MTSPDKTTNEPTMLWPSAEEGFQFLDGSWKVQNNRRKKILAGCEEWFEFESQAKFFTLLDGLVSIEELRDNNGIPFGSAMRTFDRAKRTWSDTWVAARDGIVNAPSHGEFDGDVGHWTSEFMFEGRMILSRGTWCRVNANEVTWEQHASLDKGQTWEKNWFMRFIRN